MLYEVITVLEKLNLPTKSVPDLSNWVEFLRRLKSPTAEVTVGLVGKYVELKDSYKSISEAFIHAGVANEAVITSYSIHYTKLYD